MDVVLTNIETNYGLLEGIPIGLDKYNDDEHITSRICRVKRGEQKRNYRYFKITPYKLIWEGVEKPLPEPRTITIKEEAPKKPDPMVMQKPVKKHSFFDF